MKSTCKPGLFVDLHLAFSSKRANDLLRVLHGVLHPGIMCLNIWQRSRAHHVELTASRAIIRKLGSLSPYGFVQNCSQHKYQVGAGHV